MSLIVETGLVNGGVTGAEVYVTVAEVDAYWVVRNNIVWVDYDIAVKEAAIRIACQYIDRLYRWKGQRKYAYQPMQFPRYWDAGTSMGVDMLYPGVFEVPNILKEACCQLAIEAVDGNLLPSYGREASVSSETIGPISTSYFANAPATTKRPMIDLLLAPLHNGKIIGGLSGEVTR